MTQVHLQATASNEGLHPYVPLRDLPNGLSLEEQHRPGRGVVGNAANGWSPGGPYFFAFFGPDSTSNFPNLDFITRFIASLQ